MKNLYTLLLALLLTAGPALASGTRTLDGQVITNGAATLTLPTTTDTILGRATTDTLTNKTLTAPVISTISNTGTLTLPTSTDTLVGRATTDTLTNKSISGSTNTFSNIGDAALTVPYIKADGTRAFTGDQSLGSHKLTNVTDPSSAQDAATKNYVDSMSGAPSLNGGSGTPQTVVGAVGVVLSSVAYQNFAWLSAASPTTVTATPSITACTADGQRLVLIGTSNTNTVRLDDEATTAGSKLRLNGPIVLGLYSEIELDCDITAGEWHELARR